MEKYEPELAEYYKNKRDKNEKISIKEELPKTKTWQGDAVISSYALENDNLVKVRDAADKISRKSIRNLQ